ncbi:hypothetical protein MMC25_001578 [Agyrium rufum]|nr:hypothetical protein [Agyrium rufum]
MGGGSSPDYSAIISQYRPNLTPYEEVYKVIHADPELSLCESSTAAIAVEHLRKHGYTVHTSIGGHGVIGILKNGPGRSVLLRADIDALPVREKTGLPYASTKTMADHEGKMQPVMHACGHDVHVSTLMAVAELMAAAKGEWSGTLVCLFQPDEETIGGAQAMVDDGLYDRFDFQLPDIVLGQHVNPLRAGSVIVTKGPFLSAVNTLAVRVYGKGGHGSRPETCIDPILIASSIVVRLQSVVSREIAPTDVAVVTVGAIHAGEAANVIPDFADMKLTVRTFVPEVREKVLAAIERIIMAESDASHAPQKPTITTLDSAPPTTNDPKLATGLLHLFDGYFKENATEGTMNSASEDFSNLATSRDIPYLFWSFGGCDPEKWDDAEKNNKLDDIPVNHSALFAPVIQPTIKTGVDAFALAALSYLDKRTEIQRVTRRR